MITAALTELKANGIDILKSEILGIHFYKVDFAVFLCLLAANGEIISDIDVWQKIDTNSSIDSNTLQARVCRIRTSLIEKYGIKIKLIERVKTKGYRINLVELNKILCYKDFA